ncbi:MAG: outer membrane efflux protein [Ignavibacteria bacterium]|nr:MAG: outer membrane efflux protein [Ignavibacteria bacterium]KAF0161565.1 MAG: outer membrane efflux protein [Ignavibacteria bacterium]
MILNKIKAAVILLVFTAASIVTAQEKILLTVEHAIETGLQNSKILHSSLMKVKGAEAKVKEANALRLPSLKFNARYTRLSEVDPFVISTPFGSFPIAPGIFDSWGAQATFAQPLFTGFRLLGNLELNEQLSNATNEEYNKEKSDLIFNIKNAYWSLYKASQFKKVMDETVDQVKAHLEDANNLVKNGMLTKNDVLKLEVQLSNVMYRQMEAENAVTLAMVALNSTIGISLNTQITVASSARLTEASYDDLDKLIFDAATNRAEVKAADARVKASEAGITLAKSSWYPQVSLYGNYYYSKPNQRIMPVQNEFDATWDAGVNFSMNVWDWMTTAHQTDQAEATAAQAKDGLGMIKDGIALEVTQNYLNLKQAYKKVALAELTVKQAEENMRVTSGKFKNGLAAGSDVIDAETALITAKTNLSTSTVDCELAKAKLDKSIGK